jgi:hypothetical protein
VLASIAGANMENKVMAVRFGSSPLRQPWIGGGYRPGRLLLASVLFGAWLVGTAAAITSEDFMYSAAKTGVLSISPMELSPDDADFAGDYLRSPEALIGSGCFSTGLHLPQRAELSTLTVYYFRSIAIPVVRMHRKRLAVADPAEAFVDRGLTGPNNVRNQEVIALPPALRVVRNQVFAYSLTFCLADGTDSFLGAQIEYTFTSAGD